MVGYAEQGGKVLGSVVGGTVAALAALSLADRFLGLDGGGVLGHRQLLIGNPSYPSNPPSLVVPPSPRPDPWEWMSPSSGGGDRCMAQFWHCREDALSKHANQIAACRRGPLRPSPNLSCLRQADRDLSDDLYLCHDYYCLGIACDATTGSALDRANVPACAAPLRPPAHLPVHMAQRWRLPDPGSRVGWARRGRAATDLRQVRCGPRRARQAPDQRSTAPGLIMGTARLGERNFGTYLA
jgi:hypothetical protein